MIINNYNVVKHIMLADDKVIYSHIDRILYVSPKTYYLLKLKFDFDDAIDNLFQLMLDKISNNVYKNINRANQIQKERFNFILLKPFLNKTIINYESE